MAESEKSVEKDEKQSKQGGASKRSRAKGLMIAAPAGSSEHVDLQDLAAATLETVEEAAAEALEAKEEGESADSAQKKAINVVVPLMSLAVSGRECRAYTVQSNADKFKDGSFSFENDVSYEVTKLKGALPSYRLAAPLLNVADWDPEDAIVNAHSFDAFMDMQPNGVICYVGASGSGKSTVARRHFAAMQQSGRKSCFISYGESYFDTVQVGGNKVLVYSLDNLEDALKALTRALVEGYDNILLDSLRLEVQRSHPEFSTGEKGINPGLMTSDLGGINNLAIKLGACIHVPVIAPTESKGVAMALYGQARGSVAGAALFLNMLASEGKDEDQPRTSTQRSIIWSARNLRDVRNVDSEDASSASLNLSAATRAMDVKIASLNAHQACMVKFDRGITQFGIAAGDDAVHFADDEDALWDSRAALFNAWAANDINLSLDLVGKPTEAQVSIILERENASRAVDDKNAAFKPSSYKAL